MNTTTSFYICPTCFAATETEPIGHPHAMIYIDLSSSRPNSRQPPVRTDGTLQTRRPAWFLAAAQPAWHPVEDLHDQDIFDQV